MVQSHLLFQKEKGLVNYEAYGKIELTEEAEEIAQKLLEAYDIVYLFLNDILEVSNSKEEAEKIKSVMSDDAINKLARYIHKELKLSSLDCKYDINESKCRSCIKRKGEKICQNLKMYVLQEMVNKYLTM